MQYLTLIITIVIMSSQNILIKQYNVKSRNRNSFLFSAVSSLFAMLFFMISSGSDLRFTLQFVPYSIGFAAAYAQLKGCSIYAPLAGIANGATNLLVMVLTALLPTAVLFPSISAGGIIIMFFISLLVYKEKISKQQMGVSSVILLNL